MTTSILTSKPISFQDFYMMWKNDENDVRIQVWYSDLDVTINRGSMSKGAFSSLHASRKLYTHDPDTDERTVHNFEQLLGEIHEEFMERSIPKPYPNYLPHMKD